MEDRATLSNERWEELILGLVAVQETDKPHKEENEVIVMRLTGEKDAVWAARSENRHRGEFDEYDDTYAEAGRSVNTFCSILVEKYPKTRYSRRAEPVFEYCVTLRHEALPFMPKRSCGYRTWIGEVMLEELGAEEAYFTVLDAMSRMDQPVCWCWNGEPDYDAMARQYLCSQLKAMTLDEQGIVSGAHDDIDAALRALWEESSSNWEAPECSAVNVHYMRGQIADRERKEAERLAALNDTRPGLYVIGFGPYYEAGESGSKAVIMNVRREADGSISVKSEDSETSKRGGIEEYQVQRMFDALVEDGKLELDEIYADTEGCLATVGGEEIESSWAELIRPGITPYIEAAARYYDREEVQTRRVVYDW